MIVVDVGWSLAIVDQHLHFGHIVEHFESGSPSFSKRSESTCEIRMLLGCDRLVAEEDDMSFHQHIMNFGDRLVVERRTEVDIADHGTHERRDRGSGNFFIVLQGGSPNLGCAGTRIILYLLRAKSIAGTACILGQLYRLPPNSWWNAAIPALIWVWFACQSKTDWICEA